jgi:hypothetical protein
MRSPFLRRLLVLVIAGAALLASITPVAAVAPASGAIERTWQRTDKPVADGQVSRTWMWGPQANTEVVQEHYDDSPGQTRSVQYFDKSRMEINDPNGDPTTPFYVTNGLLGVELITGREQLGDNHFEQHSPSHANVAGDQDDANGPIYASFAGLLNTHADAQTSAITQVVDRAGNVTEDASKASYAIGTTQFNDATQHWIATPFWDFMNSSGLVYQNGSFSNAQLFDPWFYATGFPITDPYWATVKVAGTSRDVLMQCFERRCLTYTPGNPDGFATEAGNVGQHYHSWRYEQIPGEGAAPCPDSPEGTYVYVADGLNDRVQKFDGDGNFVCQWVGDYDLDGPSARPQALAVDGQNFLYVNALGRIEKYDHQGRFLGSWGSGINASDIAIDTQGNLYMTDVASSSVMEYGPTGNFITQWGSLGAGDAQFDSPTGIAIDAQNNVYVADRNNNRIQKFDSDGTYLEQWNADEQEADLWGFPASVAVDAAGNTYATSIRVYKFDPSGAFVDVWGDTSDITGSGDIDVADDGTGFAADLNNVLIRHFDSGGNDLGSWGGSGSAPGQFSSPVSLATATE